MVIIIIMIHRNKNSPSGFRSPPATRSFFSSTMPIPAVDLAGLPFRRVKAAGAGGLPCTFLVPKLRMSAVLPVLAYMPSWHEQGRFCLLIKEFGNWNTTQADCGSGDLVTNRGSTRSPWRSFHKNPLDVPLHTAGCIAEHDHSQNGPRLEAGTIWGLSVISVVLTMALSRDEPCGRGLYLSYGQVIL